MVADPLVSGREARDQGAEEVKPGKGIDDAKKVANEHRSPAGGSPRQVGDLDPDERFAQRVAEEAFEQREVGNRGSPEPERIHGGRARI